MKEEEEEEKGVFRDQRTQCLHGWWSRARFTTQTGRERAWVISNTESDDEKREPSQHLGKSYIHSIISFSLLPGTNDYLKRERRAVWVSYIVFFCFDRKKQGTADNYYPLLVNHRWEMCFSTPFIIFSSSSSPSSPLRWNNNWQLRI